MSSLIDRRRFLSAAGVAAAGLSLGGCRSRAARKRPNILFIMADDHASHAMSCYGSRINRTPNLDRIAAEGMRFDNCFCTNSVCAPSRAVILTGKYSHLNGVCDNSTPFDGTQQTFPKLLQAAGYQTALLGKWHLQSDPTGFDYWYILEGQGFYQDPILVDVHGPKRRRGYVTDLITDLTLDFLRNGLDPDRPFCLLCQHKAPHRRWEPDPRYAHLYDNVRIPEPPTLNYDCSKRSPAAAAAKMRIDRDLDDQDTKGPPPPRLQGPALRRWKYQRYIKNYLRCVASLDYNVGRLLGYLDEAGLADDTLVIYTSDQGFFLGDHGWFDKRFMYEESLRMPLVARLPGTIRRGEVNRDIVLNLDFAPTLLDLAGVDMPASMQGVSLKPLLAGRTPRGWRGAMYYHYYEYPGGHNVYPHYGIRTRRYKLIHFYQGISTWELYDLRKDPHELNNVYADAAYAGVIAWLKNELKQLQHQYGDDIPWKKPGATPPVTA